ncbi:Sec-independent protein translocase protein TatB [Sphingomonas sp. IC-56]|uniref:Sec-independent protein translocase protein TatB n=1 Tax=Sphingomonas sp. IC-56 TaxID=2898529 RepID=UPI001E5819B0|nr:Sec-independent protein translocase protein TatB [Sphingomonas sp. IC-56]MCD2322400.1 Sec-independent protein translocase protein TatB [Sphingomonas sp. IC-56]
MFDVAPTELLLVAVVALLVIGPKDLPRAMHFVGKWVGKARGVARQFRSGMDSMIRDAELAEMEQKWAAENERIMREHPPAPSLPAPEPAGDTALQDAELHNSDLHEAEPVMVEQPDFKPEPAPASVDAEPRPEGAPREARP